jgi:septal ring factor EnvC (AmiA/AmiB activator)
MVPIPSSSEDRTAPPAAHAHNDHIPPTDPLGTLQASSIPIATYLGLLTTDNHSRTLHVSSQQQQPGMARVMQRPETRLEQANARLAAEVTVRDAEIGLRDAKIELLTTDVATLQSKNNHLELENDRLHEEIAALKASKGTKAARKVRDRSRRPSHNTPIPRKKIDPFAKKVRPVTSCNGLNASPF